MRRVVILPDLGQTTGEVKVLKWLKQPGERVARSEALLSVETDKVNMEVESFTDGFLRERLVQEGSMAEALKPIAIVTDTLEESYRIEAAPAARALAREVGVDLAAITGTGAGGLITRKDVDSFAGPRRAPAMAAVAAAGKRDTPHFYVSADLDVAHASAWRVGRGQHVSWNEVFVYCCCRALVECPALNVAWAGGACERYGSADIRLVAARENGLALLDIAAPPLTSFDDFLTAMRAAAPSAGPPRMAISNLGMHGVKQFAAIIPPGSTAILAIGAVRREPVVRGDAVAIGEVCSVTLSADHRVVDGIAVARYLEMLQHQLSCL